MSNIKLKRESDGSLTVTGKNGSSVNTGVSDLIAKVAWLGLSLHDLSELCAKEKSFTMDFSDVTLSVDTNSFFNRTEKECLNFEPGDAESLGRGLWALFLYHTTEELSHF